MGAALQVWEPLGTQAPHCTSRQVQGTRPLHQQWAGGGTRGSRRMNLGIR